ncbi:POLX protein, partial [Pseudoatta argentina]
MSGERPKPVISNEASQAAYNLWIAEDHKAKSDLILCISSSELKHARNCITSNEIWTKLESVYASKGPARKVALLKHLIQNKIQKGDEICIHVMFYDIVDKFQAMEIEINGDFLTIILLYSLPNSFENFRCAIESRDQLPDAESLRVNIIEEYDSRKQKTTEKDSNVLINNYNIITSPLLPRNAYVKSSDKTKQESNRRTKV